eukprot:5571836-Prymnesium_polylepis.1
MAPAPSPSLVARARLGSRGAACPRCWRASTWMRRTARRPSRSNCAMHSPSTLARCPARERESTRHLRLTLRLTLR